MTNTINSTIIYLNNSGIRYCAKLELKTAKSIEDAFTAEIKDVLQEALEEEMTNELGYTKYDWKNKNTSNSQ